MATTQVKREVCVSCKCFKSKQKMVQKKTKELVWSFNEENRIIERLHHLSGKLTADEVLDCNINPIFATL